MPPKKGTSKRAATKVAASSDAEVFNNGGKEVSQELANDAKNVANGDSIEGIDELNDSPKSTVTKRSSGRTKHVVAELEAEAPPIKKPVEKGRGKKKSNENKVIENETNGKHSESQEIEESIEEEIMTKPKGRGGGKKADTKTKKAAKAKENKKELSSSDAKEETSIQVEETKLPEKGTKVVSGRKKKQEDSLKIEEPIEEKQDIIEEVAEEKAPKKGGRNSKKTEVIAEVEPQKKKARTAKKDKIAEKDDVEETAVEMKPDVKEKKPAKRGRGTAKVVPSTEETSDLNGDAEEVLPKKRSRAAPIVEKEIFEQKPNKKGRAKKSDKEDVKIVEDDSNSLENDEDEIVAKTDAKEEKTNEVEELSSSNMRAEMQAEQAAPLAPKTATKAKGGRKRAAPSTNNKKTAIITADDADKLDDGVDNTELEDEADGSKPSKAKKGKTNTALVNATVTKYNKADFDLPPPVDGQMIEEPRFNFKISSWNVAGLRSWLKKDGLSYLSYEQPDIFCMQETKCTTEQLPEEVVRIPGYHPYWLCMPGGYAGVAIYSKIMPIHVEYGIGNKEFDNCGRIITAEYEKFFLINVYVPNSGRKLVNLEARMKWEELFQQFIQDLDARKPVVICGDMNVSHQEQDLANPKSNTRSAGFTKEERSKMTELLALGYIDTFRHLYPERKGAYTYWTYMANARSRNVGWRLDYFIVSERFIKRVVDNCIRSQCMGSDHCPITLFLKL